MAFNEGHHVVFQRKQIVLAHIKQSFSQMGAGGQGRLWKTFCGGFSLPWFGGGPGYSGGGGFFVFRPFCIMFFFSITCVPQGRRARRAPPTEKASCTPSCSS